VIAAFKAELHLVVRMKFIKFLSNLTALDFYSQIHGQAGVFTTFYAVRLVIIKE